MQWKHSDFSATKLEQEQLEVGRKVIRQNLKRSMLSFGLSILMFVVLLCSFFRDNGQIPVLVLPVCMAMTWLVARNQSKVRSWDKWDGIALVVNFLAICYGAGMVLGVIVVCAAVFFWQIIRILKHGRNGSVVLNSGLTGIFLMLSYLALFGQFADTTTAKSNFNFVTVMVLFLGAIGTLVFGFLDKTNRK